MKYHLITYGCQMNIADSEEMAQPLKERGLLATADSQEADLIVMNTCTVREQAEHRAQSNLGRLREWKEADPNRILVVAGCAASRWGNDIIKRYPFIDLVSPATQIEQFPEIIHQVLKERWNWHKESELASHPVSDLAIKRGSEQGTAVTGSLDPSIARSPTTDASWFGSESTAYVTIMRGCNYSCSYCIVPQVRGREIYRPMPQILAEIKDKVRQGFKEIMLLGQTVNSYYWRGDMRNVGADRCPPGNDNSTHADSINNSSNPSGAQRCAPTARLDQPSISDFSDLLRAVNAIEGVELIRFMSPHPMHMRDRVIQAMAECEKVARHLHLPVQSGSDGQLRAMKRLYSRQQYHDIVSKLRRAMPTIRITTDLIVGYPGETEADFQESLMLMDEINFDGIFAFKYSPRPETPAAALVDDVPEDLKEERLQRVLSRLHELLDERPRAWAN